MTLNFRRIAPGHYRDDTTGLEIRKYPGGKYWHLTGSSLHYITKSEAEEAARRRSA